jgi:surfeit locus 1 family protein
LYFKLPQIRVHLFGYLFSPGWFPTVAMLALFALLTSLGFWQLDRAKQKRVIEQSLAKSATSLTLEQISNPHDRRINYQTLNVSGQFDTQHLIYLDNKIMKHQPGVNVLTPLIIPGRSALLLVNRGFLARPDRTTLPKVTTTANNRFLSGRIYFPSKSFLLKKDIPTRSWPRIIQAIDLNKLEQDLHRPVYPFILLQENKDDVNLVREWQIINCPSYRHTGYATQWFALALTLVIIYLKLNLRRLNT